MAGWAQAIPQIIGGLNVGLGMGLGQTGLGANTQERIRRRFELFQQNVPFPQYGMGDNGSGMQVPGFYFQSPNPSPTSLNDRVGGIQTGADLLQAFPSLAQRGLSAEQLDGLAADVRRTGGLGPLTGLIDPREGAQFTGGSAFFVQMPQAMTQDQLDEIIAGVTVPGLNVPDPINVERDIYERGQIIEEPDVEALAQATYDKGQLLVAPGREQRREQLREELAQSGLLNSPAGFQLLETLDQTEAQEDRLLAAEARGRATEVQLARETLRTNIAAQVELNRQDNMFRAAMQEQALGMQANIAQSELALQGMSLMFSQQLALMSTFFNIYFQYANIFFNAQAFAEQVQPRTSPWGQAAVGIGGGLVGGQGTYPMTAGGGGDMSGGIPTGNDVGPGQVW